MARICFQIRSRDAAASDNHISINLASPSLASPSLASRCRRSGPVPPRQAFDALPPASSARHHGWLRDQNAGPQGRRAEGEGAEQMHEIHLDFAFRLIGHPRNARRNRRFRNLGAGLLRDEKLHRKHQRPAQPIGGVINRDIALHRARDSALRHNPAEATARWPLNRRAT
jgi:hypothetical protein